MPLFIVENDITKMNTDAIVISADVSLHPFDGMSKAVFGAVDDTKGLLKECDKIGFCGACECVTTHSYGLPCKYIIHSVAPIFSDSGKNAENYISTCYKNIMAMAGRKELESIAIPLIGTGKKGFPKDMVVRCAIKEISNYINKFDINVYLVAHKKSSIAIDNELFAKLEDYLSKNYTGKNKNSMFNTFSNLTNSFTIDSNAFETVSVDFMGIKPSLLTHLEKRYDYIVSDFDKVIKSEMKKNRLKDKTVYRKANIDKNAFYRLKNGINQQPSKEEIYGLIVAFKMDISNAEAFARSGGYEISTDNKQDLIFRYFIENKIYDINQINLTLFSFAEISTHTS